METEKYKTGKTKLWKHKTEFKSFQTTSVVGLQRMHRHRNIVCLKHVAKRLSAVPTFPPSCQWAWGMSVISTMDLLSHVACSHGILAMSQRSVSQFQVFQQWHSTSSRLLHLTRTMNTFSASVVTSLLARETVLRHHWSAECFEVKLEVSRWTAVTVNWQTNTDCVCLIMLKWLWLTVLSHYAELS